LVLVTRLVKAVERIAEKLSSSNGLTDQAQMQKIKELQA
jgi:hypothetical protein